MTPDPEEFRVFDEAMAKPRAMTPEDRAAAAAADAVMFAGQTEQRAQRRAAFLDQLKQAGIDAEVRHDLASRPGLLAKLMQALDAGSFDADPEAGENVAMQAILTALQAVSAIGGSAAAREDLKARVRHLWATVGQDKSGNARVRIIQRKLGRYPLSRSTILRWVNGN
jgi:hypothetical protein